MPHFTLPCSLELTIEASLKGPNTKIRVMFLHRAWFPPPDRKDIGMYPHTDFSRKTCYCPALGDSLHSQQCCLSHGGVMLWGRKRHFTVQLPHSPKEAYGAGDRERCSANRCTALLWGRNDTAGTVIAIVLVRKQEHGHGWI